MESKKSLKLAANVIGSFSLVIALVVLLLILNWFFQITPYQRLEGLPLLITIYTGPIGIILGLISMAMLSNKIAKIGIITNIILFILPWIYFYLGTLIFGP